MLQFFYKMKHNISLIFVIGPATGFLFIDQDFPHFMTFLCAVLIALPITYAASHLLKFRLWLLLCGFFFCYGLFLITLHHASLTSMIGAILAGSGWAGLIFVFPPVLTLPWLCDSKILNLGFLWAASFLLAFLWKSFFQLTPYLALSAAFLMILLAACFLHTPKFHQKAHNPLTQDREIAFFRPAAFLSAIAAALGLSVSLYQFSDQNTIIVGNPVAGDGASLPQLVGTFLFHLLICMIPLGSALFIEKKGIFSICILLVFFCEASTFFFSAFPIFSPFFLLGKCLCLAAIAAVPVVIPILVYYLYGPVNYYENYGRIIFFLPAGLVAVLPFQYLTAVGAISRSHLVVLLLLLLFLGFFSIFSAWKHRFVILKNKIL